MTSCSLNVGICGVGTVGSATIQILRRQADELTKRCGKSIRLAHVGTRRDHERHDYCNAIVTSDVMRVASDPDIDVLVELIGGTTVAYELVKLAIERGKHVVTANKALIAEHGNELIRLAEAAKVQLRFEAAVAGGIPIIKTLREGMAANSIVEIAGIINGTGNFILSEMSTNHRPFGDILSDAQALGYAEADPTFDIDGTDAAQKLVILASLAFGIPIETDVPLKQGIQEVALIDLEFAAELGYSVKHLGIARCDGDTVEMRVHPTLIPVTQQLANVDGVLNAIMLKGDAIGELSLVGPGAGGSATASAVCADLVDLARGGQSAGEGNNFVLGMPASKLVPRRFLPAEDIVSGWYVRLLANDLTDVASEISQVFGKYGIGIKSLLHKPPLMGEGHMYIVLLVDPAPASIISDVVIKITALEHVDMEVVLLRVEGFEN